MAIDTVSTLRTNRSSNETQKYKTRALVVRRGFSVQLGSRSKKISATLIPVRSSRKLNGSYSVTVNATSSTDAKETWRLTPSKNNKDVELFIPTNAPVGMYKLRDEEDLKSAPFKIFVLFNPYDTNDTVYMSDKNELHEYVLNESGRIWRGSADSFSGMPWVYAQFNVRVLLSAMDLLDRMPTNERSDAVLVSRALSALLNSSDNDNGVIMGNWSGDYSNGVAPSAWTGSLDILTRYWDTVRPVKYGQCWVFAGVYNSVLRTLGIPSQVVTNFSSAHERKPYNRILELYYDRDGKPISERAMGSTWNFHVWNMIYMRRPDLKKAADSHGVSYDGWQAVDATPQEQSQGLYQLGPCPVNAIKYGYTVNFDTDFVFGEVNADVIRYVQRGTENNSRFEEFIRDTTSIGKNMSVKKVGRDSRLDVTAMYKFKEGSEEERLAFENEKRAPLKDVIDPVSFKVICPKEVIIGNNFTYALDVKVNANIVNMIVHKANVNIVIEGTDYTGNSMGVIKEIAHEIVPSRSDNSGGQTIKIDVTGSEYESLLTKGVQTVHFDCAVIVHGQNENNNNSIDDDILQTWSADSLVRVNVDEMLTGKFSDDLHIEINEDGENVAYTSKGDEFKVVATIKNISHITLTGVKLRAEGEGIKKLNELELSDMKPGESIDVEVKCKTTKLGNRLLVMTLDTVEVMDVARSMKIVVNSNSNNVRDSENEEYGWENNDDDDVDDLLDDFYLDEPNNVRRSCCNIQ